VAVRELTILHLQTDFPAIDHSRGG